MEGKGGTPLFPDLGKHCMAESCNLLDFLPFKCDACKRLFCADHRSYKEHNCPKADMNDRVVVVCPACSETLIKPFDDEPSVALQKHADSGECDPEKKLMKSKQRSACSASRCKQILTFSNTFLCKSCHQKTCLKHRFPSDHGCNSQKGALQNGRERSAGIKFLSALATRQGTECGKAEGFGSAAASSAKVGKPTASAAVKAR